MLPSGTSGTRRFPGLLAIGWQRGDREAQQGRAEAGECDLVIQDELCEIELREACMLAGDLLGAPGVSSPQRVDQ